jgi:hypothetical protein
MGDCIEWTGGRTSAGYGQLYPPGLKGRSVLAHRWAWEQEHGPIPAGLHVCHRCDNPPCVNVNHLFLGTMGDNMRDKTRKGRQHHPTETMTHCRQGHLYDEANTRWTVRRDGLRVRTCRACRRANAAAHYVQHPRQPKTHCKRGHPFDEDNTYINTHGRKVCRACKNERSRRAYRSR